MQDELEQRIRTIHQDCETAIGEQQWDAALDGFQSLLPLLNQVGDLTSIARVHLQMGQLSEQLCQPDQAGEHYNRAEELAKQLSDSQLRAAALHRKGHLVRMSNPQEARRLFQASLKLDTTDEEAHALSLAMIGQIDFTSGDQLDGLDTMLDALTRMPVDAASREHLVEHIVYFGSKLNRADYVRLVKRRTIDEKLLQQLLQGS